MNKLSSMKSIIRLANRVAARHESQDLDDLEDSQEFSQDTQQDGQSQYEQDGQSQYEQDGQSQYEQDVEFDITSGVTEYSCRIELILDANFEGQVSKSDLLNKIKEELRSSIKTSMKNVSDSLGLESIEVKVRPIVTECAVVDNSDESLDEYGMSLSEEDSKKSKEKDSDSESEQDTQSDDDSDQEDDSDDDDSDDEEDSDEEDDSDDEEDSDEEDDSDDEDEDYEQD